MNSSPSFGLWLKARRRSLDLTQPDLARRVGCSLETIVKIESGERRPSKQVAERLAECLGVPADEHSAFVKYARVEPSSSQPLLLTQADDRTPWRALHSLHRLYGYPNNLPAQPNAFIGRGKQVVAAARLLRRPGVRLLTLTGPTGVGKTRLAVEVAAELLNEFDSGVYFVALAPISDYRLVASTIAQTLGVREAARKPLLESLKSYLRDKRTLLVLDNFEQVAPAAPLVAELLTAAPRLMVLVTSRAVLHVYGEYELRIPPMLLPDRKHPPPLDQLVEYEAVELFVERAQAGNSDFEVTSDNAAAVVEICRLLDGLPLAIELAAARVRFLSPHAMLDRLQSKEGRLKLLAGGPVNLPARQRSLRSAIAWSYNLLDDPEQTLFRRLAVFVGTFTPEAATVILDSDQSKIQNPKSKIDDILASLADKSLLRPELGPAQEPELADREAPTGREPRFRMLETIREYALERLAESGEMPSTYRRHALYYLDLAEQAEHQLRGPHQAAWLERLETEHGNLRTALHWARSQAHEPPPDAEPPAPNAEAVGARHASPLQQLAVSSEQVLPTADRLLPAGFQPPTPTDLGLRLAGALGWFWFRRSMSEGREWLGEMLALAASVPSGSIDPSSEAKALAAAGRLADHQGDYASARALYEKSRRLYEQLGNEQGQAYALCGLGFTTFREGNRTTARQLYEQGLALFRTLADARGIATALRGLGDLALHDGDYGPARDFYTHSLKLFQQLGDKYVVATLLNGLGSVALDQGDYATARTLYEESLVIFRELRDKYGIAGSLMSVGEVTRCLGDYDAALSLNEESVSIWRIMGEKWNLAMNLHNLGHVVHHKGDLARAQGIFTESLALFREAGAKMGIAICLAGLAGVVAPRPSNPDSDHPTMGDAARAARLFGAAEALLEAVGAQLQAADLDDYERNLANVRSHLDPIEFEMARQEGRAMTPEQAIAYALA
ncbi:MAG: ATP-binding protein [Chloroflexia bacterium]